MPDFSESERYLLSLFAKDATFHFCGRECKVVSAGKPRPPKGECKTDIFAKCEKVSDGEQFVLKISYKQKNAEFLENKIKAERAAQILGKDWSAIIKKATKKLKNKFNVQKLVFKDKFGHTDAGSFTLGWKFEFLLGESREDLSAVIKLTEAQKIEIFAGENLPESKRNASVNGEMIEDSGVAEYIIVKNIDGNTTLQDAINDMKPIVDYAKNADIYFACKALNYRSLHEPKPKWDGNRPLAVYILWTINDGKLTPKLVYDTPLLVGGNGATWYLQSALTLLKIVTTDDITPQNCVGDIVFKKNESGC